MILLSKKQSAVAATYLINQGFEGTGYDNSETWTEIGTGTIDEDYTGTVLAGSQSLRISTTAQSGRARCPVFSTVSGTIYVYALVRPVTLNGSEEIIFNMLDTVPTARASLNVTATGALRVTCGGSSTASVSTMSTGTTYHIWFSYTPGSGANAVATGAFSTDGIRPTSGNQFTTITSGTATASISQMDIGNSSSSTHDYIFDHVLVDDVQIGDNP